MNCPKCGYKMEIRDRICRRCLYCAEMGTFLSLDVPRRSDGSIAQISPFRKFREKILPLGLRGQRKMHANPVAQLLFGIVPGAGQILSGKILEGLLHFVAISGLILYALLSPLTASRCFPLIGLALAWHVFSVARLTLPGSLNLWQRLAVNLACLGILSALIYGPLCRLLLSLKPEYVMVPSFRRNQPELHLGWVWLSIRILAVSWLLGMVLSFLFSLKERKRA